MKTIIVEGYNCPLSDKTADVIYAIDMFFIIKNPKEFLGELNRLCKDDGMLIIDDEHQKREITRNKIEKSGYWKILGEYKDHFKCRPIKSNFII